MLFRIVSLFIHASHQTREEKDEKGRRKKDKQRQNTMTSFCDVYDSDVTLFVCLLFQKKKGHHKWFWCFSCACFCACVTDCFSLFFSQPLHLPPRHRKLQPRTDRSGKKDGINTRRTEWSVFHWHTQHDDACNGDTRGTSTGRGCVLLWCNQHDASDASSSTGSKRVFLWWDQHNDACSDDAGSTGSGGILL